MYNKSKNIFEKIYMGTYKEPLYPLNESKSDIMQCTVFLYNCMGLGIGNTDDSAYSFVLDESKGIPVSIALMTDMEYFEDKEFAKDIIELSERAKACINYMSVLLESTTHAKLLALAVYLSEVMRETNISALIKYLSEEDKSTLTISMLEKVMHESKNITSWHFVDDEIFSKYSER